MSRADRRREERARKKEAKNQLHLAHHAPRFVHTGAYEEEISGAKHRYLQSLLAEAEYELSSPQALTFAEATRRAASGRERFWSFRADREYGKVTGAALFVLEPYTGFDEDAAPEDPWSLTVVEGNFNDESMGFEDYYGPGSPELDEFKDLRFVPCNGEFHGGEVLSLSLAKMLGRPEAEQELLLF